MVSIFSAATPPTPESTQTTTGDKKEPPSTGARGSGLSEGALWGIVGGCIAFVIIVAIIILVCCICKKKSNKRGASKGKQYYFKYFLSEALTLENCNCYLTIFDKVFLRGGFDAVHSM